MERPGGPTTRVVDGGADSSCSATPTRSSRGCRPFADLAAFSGGEAGTLRIATYQSVSARVLPTLIRRFQDAWSKVDVQLIESALDDELELPSSAVRSTCPS